MKRLTQEHPLRNLIACGRMLMLVSAVLIGNSAAGSAPSSGEKSNPAHRQWIEEMKTSQRGPFERIRWFCNDGSVLPPKAYACVERGGGQTYYWLYAGWLSR